MSAAEYTEYRLSKILDIRNYVECRLSKVWGIYQYLKHGHLKTLVLVLYPDPSILVGFLVIAVCVSMAVLVKWPKKSEHRVVSIGILLYFLY